MVADKVEVESRSGLDTKAHKWTSDGKTGYDIAEIKKDANLILEEDRRDIYTEVSGEVFLQNVQVEESIDNQGATKKVSKTAGLVWVLYGDSYVLQN